MVTEKELQRKVQEVPKNAKVLLDFCLLEYETPIEALMALILGSGTLAVAVGMDRADLLEGIGKAWDMSDERLSPRGGSHVH